MISSPEIPALQRIAGFHPPNLANDIDRVMRPEDLVIRIGNLDDHLWRELIRHVEFAEIRDAAGIPVEGPEIEFWGLTVGGLGEFRILHLY